MMYNDIRMEECEKEIAIEFVEKCRGQWIYIKTISNIYVDNSESHQTALYTKFRVRSVLTKYKSIEIYGEEDDDRLIIDDAYIVSTQITLNQDELLIIVEQDSNEIDIRIKKYNPTLRNRLDEIVKSSKNLIITEGKTDWKHLKNALNCFNQNGEYLDFDFSFFEYEDEFMGGADTIQKVCEYNKLFENSHIKIFIYDADVESINKIHQGKKYVYHGNNVYSLVIPIPEFRKETPEISIENYYADEDIQICDDFGRRIFLNKEFNHSTGELLSNKRVFDLNYRKHEKMGANYIIDDKVMLVDEDEFFDGFSISDLQKLIFDKKGKQETVRNIALSKNRFAENIMNQVEPFDRIDYRNYRILFDLIMEIEEANRERLLDISSQKVIARIDDAGVVLNLFENGLKTMEIHTNMPDKLVAYGKKTSTLAKMNIVDGMLIIGILVGESDLSIKIPLTLNIIEFLHDKIDNPYNRIELYCHRDNECRIIELFSGDDGSAIIERMLLIC